MEHIFEQITATLEAELPYPAIVMSLSLPDICANLQLSEEAREGGQKKRYMRWCERYVCDALTNVLSAEDLWSLRCGVVHKGQFGNRQQKFDRVYFSTGSPMTILHAENNIINGVHYGKTVGIDVKYFCGTIIAQAEKWFRENENDKVVVDNLQRVVRFYPNAEALTPGLIDFGRPVSCIA